MSCRADRKRVAIAKNLIQPADLLILDEPTNHLDNETIEWLEGYLAQYPGAVMLVTHDRYFLNRVTNRIYELENGSLYTYQGNYEVFLEKRAEREAQAEQKKQSARICLDVNWLGSDEEQKHGQQNKSANRQSRGAEGARRAFLFRCTRFCDRLTPPRQTGD